MWLHHVEVNFSLSHILIARLVWPFAVLGRDPSFFYPLFHTMSDKKCHPFPILPHSPSWSFQFLPSNLYSKHPEREESMSFTFKDISYRIHITLLPIPWASLNYLDLRDADRCTSYPRSMDAKGDVYLGPMSCLCCRVKGVRP